METLFIGQNKITLHSVDSTNNYAAKLFKMSFVPDGTVIMAQSQTEGKGQRDNVWESEAGKNLLSSFILKPPDLDASLAFFMSKIAALSVRDLINDISSDSSVYIKWPNDIMLNGKKVSGILIENALTKNKLKYAIVGIGVNVNQKPEKYRHATSLKDETSIIIDTDSLLSNLSQHLEKWYLRLLKKDYELINLSYNEHLWLKDQTASVVYQGRDCYAEIKSVDSSGFIYFNLGKQKLKAGFNDLKINYE